MFKGRRFQDNVNQKIVTVVEENGTWVTLDDGRNVKPNVFQMKFSEYLEADNFFTNDSVMENLAQQFSQQINLNTIPVVNQDGSNITYNNPNVSNNNPANNAPAGYFIDDAQLTSEAAKRELLDKFNNTYRPPAVQHEAIDMSQIGVPQEQRGQPLQRRERPAYVPPEESDTVVKNANTGQVIMESQPRVQQASYTEAPPRQQSNDDIYKIYEQNKSEFVQTPVRPPEQRPVEQPRMEQRPIEQEQFRPEPPPYRPPVDQSYMNPEQEAFMFFRKFKKIHPVKIDVSFDEMIADPNYVRQTAMNFEGDVIKFYTQELMKKLYADPTLLEQQIYDSLKLSIMGEEYVNKEKEEKHRENLKKYKTPAVFVIEVDNSNTEPLQIELSPEMKIAAQTIGLDLTEVKPTGNTIEIMTPGILNNLNSTNWDLTKKDENPLESTR